MFSILKWKRAKFAQWFFSETTMHRVKGLRFPHFSTVVAKDRKWEETALECFNTGSRLSYSFFLAILPQRYPKKVRTQICRQKKCEKLADKLTVSDDLGWWLTALLNDLNFQMLHVVLEVLRGLVFFWELFVPFLFDIETCAKFCTPVSHFRLRRSHDWSTRLIYVSY